MFKERLDHLPRFEESHFWRQNSYSLRRQGLIAVSEATIQFCRDRIPPRPARTVSGRGCEMRREIGVGDASHKLCRAKAGGYCTHEHITMRGHFPQQIVASQNCIALGVERVWAQKTASP
jgi:hypothetical protein